jgi:hypothetical protein
MRIALLLSMVIIGISGCGSNNGVCMYEMPTLSEVRTTSQQSMQVSTNYSQSVAGGSSGQSASNYGYKATKQTSQLSNSLNEGMGVSSRILGGILKSFKNSKFNFMNSSQNDSNSGNSFFASDSNQRGNY